METFLLNTEKLVSKTNTASLPPKTIGNPKDSANAANEYHTKGARGRRNSVYSVEEFQPSVSSLDASKMSEDLSERSQSKKKDLKQVKAALELNEKEIEDLEKTITVKETLMERLLKHKDTKSSAHDKLEMKCQMLLKEHKNAELKLFQAKTHKDHAMEEKYKRDVAALEKKLQDAEYLKNCTEDGGKLLELATSLHTSRKKLDRLKKYKAKKESQRKNLEKQCREEKGASIKSANSNESVSKHSKALALFDSRAFSPRDDEESRAFRHEIRKLRKSREYFLEQRCKLTRKSPNKKPLTDHEERKLLQFEETVEAIDVIIEYKNMLICRQDPQIDSVPDERGDKMLMERFLKLSEDEMRLLLRRYFEKIVELRCSSKKLESQMLEIENQNDNLIYGIRDLNHTLELVRSEAERRILSLQQQHQDRLSLILRNLSRVCKYPANTVQVALDEKPVEKNKGDSQVGSTASQAKVTREKNKIILQKTTRK